MGLENLAIVTHPHLRKCNGMGVICYSISRVAQQRMVTCSIQALINTVVPGCFVPVLILLPTQALATPCKVG